MKKVLLLSKKKCSSQFGEQLNLTKIVKCSEINQVKERTSLSIFYENAL